MRFVWILAVAAGCGPGKGKVDHGADPVDSTTSSDDSGGSELGPALVWVDAEGAEVEGVAYLGDRLTYADESGYLWPLDPWESGTAAFGVGLSVGDSQTFWGTAVFEIVYADDSCTTPWTIGDRTHLEVLLPNQVGIVPYSGLTEFDPGALEGRTFVVPPDIDLVTLTPVWAQYTPNDCYETSLPGRVAISDLIEVEPPATWWVPPLHPEWR